MKKVQIKNHTLYLGDSAEILPTLDRVDLCLTDPPYGLGEKWSGGTWAANEIYKDAFDWDAKPVPMEHIQKCVDSAANTIIWGGNYYLMPPSRCWLSWTKTQQMNTMADFELAWTNLDKPSKSWTENRNPDGKREHPTQKPISLMSWCLEMVPGIKTVIDPFMGSGTTGLACLPRGLTFIGIEKHKKYFDLACKRIEAESRQELLFTDEELNEQQCPPYCDGGRFIK